MKPGLSLSSHVSNCFSSGVRVLGLGLGLGFRGGGDWGFCGEDEWRRIERREVREERCRLISTAIAIDFVSISDPPTQLILNCWSLFPFWMAPRLVVRNFQLV